MLLAAPIEIQMEPGGSSLGCWANISCSNASIFNFSLLRPSKLTSPLNTHAPEAQILLTCVHTYMHMYPFAYLRLGTRTHSSVGTDALEHTYLMTACTGKWWGSQGVVRAVVCRNDSITPQICNSGGPPGRAVLAVGVEGLHSQFAEQRLHCQGPLSAWWGSWGSRGPIPVSPFTSSDSKRGRYLGLWVQQ